VSPSTDVSDAMFALRPIDARVVVGTGLMLAIAGCDASATSEECESEQSEADVVGCAAPMDSSTGGSGGTTGGSGGTTGGSGGMTGGSGGDGA